MFRVQNQGCSEVTGCNMGVPGRRGGSHQKHLFDFKVQKAFPSNYFCSSHIQCHEHIWRHDPQSKAGNLEILLSLQVTEAAFQIIPALAGTLTLEEPPPRLN